MLCRELRIGCDWTNPTRTVFNIFVLWEFCIHFCHHRLAYQWWPMCSLVLSYYVGCIMRLACLVATVDCSPYYQYNRRACDFVCESDSQPEVPNCRTASELRNKIKTTKTKQKRDFSDTLHYCCCFQIECMWNVCFWKAIPSTARQLFHWYYESSWALNYVCMHSALNKLFSVHSFCRNKKAPPHFHKLSVFRFFLWHFVRSILVRFLHTSK